MVNRIINILDNNSNYWLVRTEGGIYYDQFVAKNNIAVGWNEISDLDTFKKAANDEKEKERLLCLIRELVDKEEDSKLKKDSEKEKKKTRIYNQINRFINEMQKGDFVLIPSQGSNLIEFGIITSDAYIVTQSNVVDAEEGECDFIKRRNVEWLYREKRDMLDPYLYRLIYSQHAISIANDYSHYIDRTIYKFYIKGDQAHLVLEIQRQSEIYGSEFIQTMSSILGFVDLFNKSTGSNYDKNSVQVKINVQSPGPVELFGKIEVILAIGAVLAAVFGGNFSILGIKFETPGLLEHLRKFREQKQTYNLEKERLALERMQIRVPPELQPDAQEDTLIQDQDSN